MNYTKQQELPDFLEYEHPDRTLLKRDIQAIALKRMEDAARSMSDFEEVIKQWDHLDDNHERKELLYFLYIRDYSAQKLAAMRNQSDRNIRGVRSTVLGQIEKKVLLVLADRLGQDFPFTGEERDFLSRHSKDLPTALEKLDKEKLAIIKKIGVIVRKIAREQAQLETKQDKNNTNDKKAV